MDANFGRHGSVYGRAKTPVEYGMDVTCCGGKVGFIVDELASTY